MLTMPSVTTKRLLLRRNPDFRRLWLAQASSSYGEFAIESTLVVWAVASISNSAAQAATLSGALVLAAALPRVLIGSAAGVVVDRSPSPIRVMIAADLSRAVLLLLAFLVVAGGSFLGQRGFIVVLVTLILSCFSQFFAPARAVVLQQVVESDDRPTAAGLANLATTGVAIIATGTGPAIYALAGPSVALALGVVTFAISAFFVGLIKGFHPRTSASVSRSSFWKDLREGIHAVSSNRVLRVIAFSLFLYGFSLGVNNVALSIFGLRTLQLPPSQYGYLMALFPIGGVIGSLVAPVIINKVGRLRGFLLSLILLGALYAGYAVSTGFLAPALIMFALGVTFSTYAVALGPVLLDAAPEKYMGRIHGLTYPIMALATLIGTGVSTLLLNGAVPVWFDLDGVPRLCFALSAALLLVGGLLISRMAKHGEATEPA